MIEYMQGVLSGGSTPPEPSNIVDYGLAAGQSNMAGRGDSTQLTGDTSYLSGLTVVDGNTAYIKNRAINPNSFDVMEAGVNTSDTVDDFGTQLELAYRMCEYKQKDFNYIQCAFGGTPIEDYVYGSDNFTWIMDEVRSVRYSLDAEGKELRIPFMIWIQGESNAGDLSTYKSDLIQMINDYRVRLQQPNMTFVIGQMIDCQTGVVNLAQLQQIQLEVSQEVDNCILVPKSLAVNTCSDPLHWDNDYYISAGNYIFEQVKDL
jgi:hypothetical protein